MRKFCEEIQSAVEEGEQNRDNVIDEWWILAPESEAVRLQCDENLRDILMRTKNRMLPPTAVISLMLEQKSESSGNSLQLIQLCYAQLIRT